MQEVFEGTSYEDWLAIYRKLLAEGEDEEAFRVAVMIGAAEAWGALDSPRDESEPDKDAPAGTPPEK